MLSNNQKEKLKKNWGDLADNLACKAEIRVYDPLSKWECYIYAMNPDDEDEIDCIVTGAIVFAGRWTISELFAIFNADGEFVKIDPDFVPRCAKTIYDKLKQREYNEFYRDSRATD